ncbi:MAG: DUF4262 domain-containing protein [Actinomycetes bacterium]
MEATDLILTCWTDIDARGFLVAAVEGGAQGCDWAYTVGLHLTTGHPELVLVGLDAAVAGGLLDAVGQRIVDGLVLDPGEPVWVGPVELGVREVDPLWRSHGDWFALGRAVLGRRGLDWPPTLQVVWTDRTGAAPERPGDPDWALRQPLLAER